ncbi:AMP-binding protein [Williamsia phyllosphaerae]|uniref:Acyl-CoA synthetase n=1 Tax=Williamsia phyllosphaerae TaxID=885042 RepID=A0ABQ1UPA8_9NOCA|nr:AMP-binding protein [Williamsia phyllosphaerae]GGF22025.1 acyl-CoA synthetase [Williamsia phyllosphaerae]
MSGLDTQLTPLRFLDRAAEVHPEAIGIVDGDRRLTNAEFAAAAQQLAGALRDWGVSPGDRVAYLATNRAELLIAHYGVPLAGGVLVAINTRLSPEEVAYICRHSGSSLLLGDADLLGALGDVELPVREVVSLDDIDAFTARGGDGFIPWEVADETATITINYTSGTTGRPKGVMYTHRGAYLNALSEVIHQGFDHATRYLWTLPMFHCNGWCTTWAVTAVSGRHVCLPAVRGAEIWRLVDTEGIDHMCGAPTVLSTLASAPEAHQLDGPLTVVTAGAPPSPTVVGQIRSLGATLVHVYGLTETYGPYSICEPQDGWGELSSDELDVVMARQGVGMVTADPLRVVRPDAADDGSLIDVTPDGVEMGEIVMRGNCVMKGYFDDQVATTEAFAGGWFHSGDLGVMLPDGYVKLLDRAKDVVISGGENISTIEVEQALASHPAVADVVVIGVADDKWGERPKAFVVLADGAQVEPAELTRHVKSLIASFKAPRDIEFTDAIPRTSTGKVRKNELRDAERDSTPH